MKPRILVVGEDGFNGEIMHFVINRQYGSALSTAGALPLLALDTLHAADYLPLCHGLFLTGGPDMHCARYGDIYEKREDFPPFSRTRDDLDFVLCRLFLAAGRPIFGVGRGMQVLNVALGGTLWREVPAHPGADTAGDAVHTPAVFGRHSIETVPGSRIAAVLGREPTVNSCHHQAVKTLGTGLCATASASDGVIEAIEHESLPVFGVQWHPERDEADPRLFEAFVKLCREVSL